MSDSLQPHGLYPNRHLSLWGFSSPEYWSGLPCPPSGDLPNPGSPALQQILYHLSHQGSPRILEWVADPFFRGSSWPRNRTGVSCFASRFFTSWAVVTSFPSTECKVPGIKSSLSTSGKKTPGAMPASSTKESEMQYLDAISKMTEWYLLISKANYSVSQ